MFTPDVNFNVQKAVINVCPVKLKRITIKKK